MSTRRTDRWGFSLLGPGDSLADDGYKYTDADIQLIDRLLKYAAEDHRHTGAVGTDNTPDAPPLLTLDTTGGGMASGVRFYYKITVVDGTGNESAASALAYLDTPPPVGVPGAPVLSVMYGPGALSPGTYTYALSAYKDDTLLESKALNSAVITVAGSSATGEITLDLPALPPGADGYNVYRKSPSGMHFLWLASTILGTYVDDGSGEGNCDRSLPARNRTSSTNLITIALPGATPVLPAGSSWRIYRTDDPTTWNHSFLAEIAPDGSPEVLEVTYDDLGGSTQTGAPPIAAQIIQAPSKILLTDAAEVQGTLPPGLVTIPHVVTFHLPGLVEVQEWPELWVCEYDDAYIVSCRATCGVDAPPATADVIVDVNAFRLSDATPTWASIYEDGVTRPRVPVGEIIGDASEPIVRRLTVGDVLCVDVDQAGGGATPTDAYLTVNILLLVRDGSTTESWDWSA